MGSITKQDRGADGDEYAQVATLIADLGGAMAGEQTLWGSIAMHDRASLEPFGEADERRVLVVAAWQGREVAR